MGNKNSADRTTTRDPFRPIPDLLVESLKRAQQGDQDIVPTVPRSRKKEFGIPIRGAKFLRPSGEETPAGLDCDYLSDRMEQGPYDKKIRQKRGKAVTFRDRRH